MEPAIAARENAAIREEILRRGLATEEQLDRLALQEISWEEILHPRGRGGEWIRKLGGGDKVIDPTQIRQQQRAAVAAQSERRIARNRLPSARAEAPPKVPTGEGVIRTLTGPRKGLRRPQYRVFATPSRAEPGIPEGMTAEQYRQEATRPDVLRAAGTRRLNRMARSERLKSRQARLKGDHAAAQQHQDAAKAHEALLQNPAAVLAHGQKEVYETRTKALERRIQRNVRAAGERVTPAAGEVRGPHDLSAAEVNFNDAGHLSQKTLLAYAEQAVTRPTTAQMYRDKDGNYHPSRKVLHEHIIDKMLRQHEVGADGKDLGLSSTTPLLKPPRGKPTVVFTGGGYAAGKSGMHKMIKAQGAWPKDALLLDPDLIKSELPEFKATALDDPEANLRVYSEAWDIAQEVQKRAQDKGLNVVVDGITDTHAKEVEDRVKSFTDKGYANPRIFYASTPTDDAIDRAKRRAAKGKTLSSRRMIPESIVRSVHRDVSATMPGVMNTARTNEKLGLRVGVYDTNRGRDAATGEFNPPKLVAEASPDGLHLPDSAQYEKILDKAKEQIPATRQVTGPMPTGQYGRKDIVDKLQEAQARGLNDWPKPSSAPVPGGKSSAEIFAPLISKGLTGQDIGTHRLYGDGKGRYTTERGRTVHNDIVRKAFSTKDGNPMADFVTDSDGIITGVRPLVDTDQPPKMLFMMGGSASGKSSALAQAGGDVEPRNAITLDPDNIKGQLPEYDQMMGSRHPETLPNGTVIQVPDNPDKFAAAGVHEESSDLAKRIQKMAQEAGMNIVVDGTGDNNPAQGNEPSKFAKKILKAKKDGYDVSVFGVNAPTNVAVVDATDRARQTGRYVPEPEMRKIHKNVSANLPEIQRLTENGTISNAQFWDRSRGDMRQIMRFNPNTQSFELLDPKGWQDMLDKATEEPTPAAGMAAARAGAVA